MTNLAITILQEQLSKSHEYFLGTLDGVDEKIAHFQPAGKANPIAGTWAHAIFTEDGTINEIFQHQPPLFKSSWKDRTGADSLQPTDWANEYPKWLRTVKIEVPKFKEYTEAVFKNSEKYLSNLTDTDLDKEVKMSWEPTPRKMYDLLNAFVLSHLNNIMGEISVLKGLQGLKGYPF